MFNENLEEEDEEEDEKEIKIFNYLPPSTPQLC